MSVYTPITPDPEHSLAPSGNLRRRLLINRTFESSTLLAAVIAVGVLVMMVSVITSHGVGAINGNFFTKALPQPPLTGGMGPAIVGTVIIVACTIVIALPISVLVALLVTEFIGPRAAAPIKALIDVMNGLPTIVVGVFVFALLVANGGGDAAWKGSVALAIVVVPLITRSTIEALNRVPGSMREAADALGIARWRTVLGVILPTAAPGIVTASILGAARAAGETAPLLFVSSLYGPNFDLNPLHALPSIPLEIWFLTNSGYAAAVQDAWGAAFVLMIVILVANIGARVMLRRAQRKRGL